MIKKIALLFIILLLAACNSPKKMPWTKKAGALAELTRQEASDSAPEKEILAIESVADARLKARQAIAENEIDTAQAYYVKAYGIEPDNIELLQEMAQLYKMIHKDDLVELCYQLILKQDPSHYQTIRQYGLLLIRLNQYQAAKDKLLQALATAEGQKDWNILNGLGLIEDLQGQHNQAIAYFLLALEIAPKQIDVLNNIAYSLYRVGDYDEALRYYKQALAIEPKNSKVLFNYGLLRARTRHYTSAVSIFSRLMSPAKAHNDVGYIAMKNGDFTQAQYFLHKARELSASFYKKAYDNQQILNSLQQK